MYDDNQSLLELQAVAPIVLSTTQDELQTSEAESSLTGQNLHGEHFQ